MILDQAPTFDDFQDGTQSKSSVENSSRCGGKNVLALNRLI
jgi:hypothetical protein